MTDLLTVDFGADTAGILHLRTRQEMVAFALNALCLVAVAFLFAVAMTL